MAESDVNPDLIRQEEPQVEKREKLKYLDFVQVAAGQAVLCLSWLYGFAKENSGPLKPGVESVEGTVKAVVGPVYDKFHGVPFEVLKFVDHKVEDSIEGIERHLPSLVKEASNQVCSISGEFRQAGVIGSVRILIRAAERTAKELYGKYEPVAEQYAVSAWRCLNRLPVFPQVAHVLVPTAAYWSDKYNKTVMYSAEKGYAVSAYLPLVPVERIPKVFGENGEAVESTSQ